MTLLIESIEDFTLTAYQRVVWGGESLSFTPECLRRVHEWRTEFLAVLDSHMDASVYGVNVGAGDGSFQKLDKDGQRDYRNGLNSATSFGSALPDRVVRGIIFTRLSSFIDGSSAVTPELVEHVAAMLDRPLPVVPAEGTGGSGEILPLGHLFQAIPSVFTLGLKESMTLINGAPCAGALAVDTAVRSQAMLASVDNSFALACDALNASESHFDEALALTWQFPSEDRALRRLRDLLSAPSCPRSAHQARVSVRILPRVLGCLYQEVDAVKEVARKALRGAGDNPIFVPSSRETGAARIISNGSFHNHRVVTAIDNISRALADLTQLAQHFIHALYQDRTAMPTQDNLGLGTVYMVAADWSEEARLHAVPSLLSFAAVGQNDVTNPLFSAWRKFSRVEECLTAQLAILSTISSQSLYSTGRTATPALRDYLGVIRSIIEPIDDRRDMGVEIGRLNRHLRNSQREACTEWID